MALKDKRLSPEDRKILEVQIERLEKENKELRTTKEAFIKLKESFAKLEIENSRLRNSAEQEASLKKEIESLRKLDQQRQLQIEQHRTLLEEARNTIAYLKQILEEKGILYDVNALNAMSKGMTGSKWSLMEELERKLLEILKDKSKSKQEIKEAIFAEIGTSVARLIEMEDEREKNKSEPEVIEVNNLEEEDSDNKGEMDGMLQTLNHQIERENQAANAKAKAKRKKGVKEEKKRERKDSGKPSSANDVEDDMEKQLAEKLRQKIADSLDKSKVGDFNTPLEWACFVQASIDEWKRDVEEARQKQQPLPQSQTPAADGQIPKPSDEGEMKATESKGEILSATKQPLDSGQEADVVIVDIEPEIIDESLVSAVAPQVPAANGEPKKTRANRIRKARLERNISLGEEMIMSLSREAQEKQELKKKQKTEKLKRSIRKLKEERVEWERERERYEQTCAEYEKLRIGFRKAREEWNRKNTALREKLKAKEERLGATRQVLEQKKKRIDDLKEEVMTKSGQLNRQNELINEINQLKNECELTKKREVELRLDIERIENCSKICEAEAAEELKRRREIESRLEELQGTLRKTEEEHEKCRAALMAKDRDAATKAQEWASERMQYASAIEERENELKSKEAELSQLVRTSTDKKREWCERDAESKRQITILTQEIESRRRDEERTRTEVQSLFKILGFPQHSETQWEDLRAGIEELRASAMAAQASVAEKQSELSIREQKIAELQDQLNQRKITLSELKQALAAKTEECKKEVEDNERLVEERWKEKLAILQEEESDEKQNTENHIKRLEDMLNSLIDATDKNHNREEELVKEIQKKDELIKELQTKVEQLEHLLDQQRQKRRIKKTHSMRLQRELVQTQQALEEKQRLLDREMQQHEEERERLELAQKEKEEQLQREKEQQEREEKARREQELNKHQQAIRTRDSELLAAFTAAAKEQVDMALTLAREAEVLMGRFADSEKTAAALASIQQLRDNGNELMKIIEATSKEPSNPQMQQVLMQKQRELGQAIQRVVINTTIEGASDQLELQRAVEAMATATGAGLGEWTGTNTEDANVDNVDVMAAAQEAINEIESAFSLRPANALSSSDRTVVGRIVDKVKRFARLLKQVASKTDDPKFKKELLEYSNILPDRATQLRIIAAVKSAAKDESSQLSSAAQGLKVSIQESLEILSVASLKKGLAATINQVSALKSLLDAWKTSNTLAF